MALTCLPDVIGQLLRTCGEVGPIRRPCRRFRQASFRTLPCEFPVRPGRPGPCECTLRECLTSFNLERHAASGTSAPSYEVKVIVELLRSGDDRDLRVLVRRFVDLEAKIIELDRRVV